MIPDLRHLKHRDELGPFLNRCGLIGQGAEVGTAYAEYAEKVLAHWAGQKMFLVDPYINQPWTTYRDQTNRMNMDSCFDHARDRLKRFAERHEFVRQMSVVGATLFTDGQLDFVFIDGNHCYAAVVDDLRVWWPKVKSGGIFGGHDFYSLDTPDDLCEVPRAVSEFAAAQVAPVWFTRCSSWWIAKP